MACCGHYLCVFDTQGVQVSGEPLRRALHVSSTSGIAAQTGNTQKLEKLMSKPLRMITRVFACILAQVRHRCSPFWRRLCWKISLPATQPVPWLLCLFSYSQPAQSEIQ